MKPNGLRFPAAATPRSAPPRPPQAARAAILSQRRDVVPGRPHYLPLMRPTARARLTASSRLCTPSL
jgi:hypothetical protein